MLKPPATVNQARFRAVLTRCHSRTSPTSRCIFWAKNVGGKQNQVSASLLPCGTEHSARLAYLVEFEGTSAAFVGAANDIAILSHSN